jgi:fructan beta-fructosidase
MAVYDEADGKRWIAFHTSADLKAWEYQSRVEGFYECPDLFELPVDGDAGRTKWVLTAASSEYMVGTFDGRAFKPETPKLPGHRGDAMYAAQTYSDAPDGRRVQIGWGRVATPGMPFNQMMTFPCDLSLRSTPGGPRLAWQPVKEIESLRGDSHAFKDILLRDGDNLLRDVKQDLSDVSAEFDAAQADEVGFRVRGLTIAYNPKKQELTCGDRKAPLPPTEDGRVRLRLLVDRTSVEVFAGDGLVYLPMAAPRKGGAAGLEVFAKGSASVRTMTVFELRPAWPEVGGK